jgi:hypothetical protein
VIKEVTTSNSKSLRQRRLKVTLRASQRKTRTQSVLTSKQTKVRSKQNRRKHNDANKTEPAKSNQRNPHLEDQSPKTNTMEVTETNVMISNGHSTQTQLHRIDQSGNEDCTLTSKQGLMSSKQ